MSKLILVKNITAFLIFSICTTFSYAKVNFELIDPEYSCESNYSTESKIVECMVNKFGNYGSRVNAAYDKVISHIQSLESSSEDSEALVNFKSAHKNWVKYRNEYCAAEGRLLYTRPIEVYLTEKICIQDLNKKQVDFYNELIE